MQESGRSKLSQEHYKELAKWFERVAVLVLASLVIQKIVFGRFGDPVIYLGAIAVLVFYLIAYQLLIRS